MRRCFEHATDIKCRGSGACYAPSGGRARRIYAAMRTQRDHRTFHPVQLGTNMKILAVDDDMELLGLIGFALRQAGYLVIEASDGGAALANFEREQPDLVILDVNLPVVSGFDVCRRIRAEGSTPIMMLTVRSSE